MKAIFKESDCSILNINYTKGQVVEVEKINNNEYMDIETGFYFLTRELEFVKSSNEDPIVVQVIDKFKERSEKGIQTYGTTLHDNNTDDFLNHLQEELMDAVLYIQKLRNGSTH